MEAGHAGCGSTVETVVLGRISALLGAVKLVIEWQMSAAWFDLGGGRKCQLKSPHYSTRMSVKE